MTKRTTIPTMKWRQIGGDMSPDKYGAIIAKADGSSIELIEIQPVRNCVGDRDALEVGFPFWSKQGYYTLDDLDTSDPTVKSALDYVGLSDSEALPVDPSERALCIAEALLSYGAGSDEGPAGWAKDVIPNGDRVLWWGSKHRSGWRYLKDEDIEFRTLIRESR